MTGMLGGMPPWMLLAGGTALGWVRNFWSRVYQATVGQVVSRVSVSVTIEEDDHSDAYLWLQQWVQARLRKRRINTLQLRRRVQRSGDKGDCPAEGSGGPARQDTSYELLPAAGVYPIRWRRKLVVFRSAQENPQAPGAGGGFFRPRRSVNLTIWGTRDRELLLTLLSDAQAEWDAAHPQALNYYLHRWSNWRARPLPPRRASTVYLPDGVLDGILADARRFLGARPLCERLGVPWRRGYLFHGPPGTGKTTLVQTLATELGMNLYYLCLAAVGSRDDLMNLLDNVEPGSILLMEDVDCLAAAADRMNPAPAAPGAPVPAEKITPSDLLNFIDGIVAGQGRLLVMTTNYPERLDAALTRSGRVDRKWKIDYTQTVELLRFRQTVREAGLDVPAADEYLAMLPDRPTIADAQALLLGGEARAEVHNFVNS